MRIFLIGYMGAGKSTVGKQLARELNVPWFDLDAVITENEEQTIQEIFDKNGESGFRGAERNYLQKIVEAQPNMVLSTGGGTPCFYDNMHFMQQNGTVVYLEMDPGTLAHRLKNSKASRPLIRQIPEDQLKIHIRNHLEERIAIYNDAHIVFPAMGMNKGKIEKLIAQLKEFN